MQIRKVSSALYRIPVHREMHDAIRHFSHMDLIIAHVETDEGLAGSGFTYSIIPHGAREICSLIDNSFHEMLAGMDPRDHERVWSKMWRGGGWGGRGGIAVFPERDVGRCVCEDCDADTPDQVHDTPHFAPYALMVARVHAREHLVKAMVDQRADLSSAMRNNAVRKAAAGKAFVRLHMGNDQIHVAEVANGVMHFAMDRNSIKRGRNLPDLHESPHVRL